MDEHNKNAEEQGQDTPKVNGVPVQDAPQSSLPETPSNEPSEDEKKDLETGASTSTDDVTYDVPPADL